MPAPPNYVFTTFAFVSFFLCLIRFPVQLCAWNVGIILFLVSVGLECLCLGINSIIWNRNTANWAPVWCDITSRFYICSVIAIPAVLLCINRRLYLLASSNSILSSEADKRREIMIDVAIGIGLPIIIIIFSFFARNSRLIILEDIGCTREFRDTWLIFIIIGLPLVLLELIAGVYGYLSTRAFYKHHSEMNELLSSYQNLNSSRYIRLICFSVCDLLVGIPITVIYLACKMKELVPFPGPASEHHHFSEIIQVPAVVWRANMMYELSIELNRWIFVYCAFLFFVVFGLTQESCIRYRATLQFVAQTFMMIIGIPLKAEESTAHELSVITANSELVITT